MVLVESSISLCLSIQSHFIFLLLIEVLKVVSGFWWYCAVTSFARLRFIMKRGIYPTQAVLKLL